jgi:hypothetical protein
MPTLNVDFSLVGERNQTSIYRTTGVSDVRDEPDGVFELLGQLPHPITALISASVTEGRPDGEFVGDAVFQVVSAQWSNNGQIRIILGQWHHRALLGAASFHSYKRNLTFTVCLEVL